MALERSINEILSAQLAALGALDSTLEAEKQAILDRDTEALNRAVAAKSERLLELRALETERRSATMQLTDDDLGTLRAMFERVKARNQANGALIQVQRQHLGRLLRLLRGADAAHYDRDGRQLETGRRTTLASI